MTQRGAVRIAEVADWELYAFDFWSTSKVSADGKCGDAFAYGLGDVVPTTQLKAQAIDTNVLPGSRPLCGEFLLECISWSVVLPSIEKDRVLDALLGSGRWAFHVGGEKPVYEATFASTIASVDGRVVRSRKIPFMRGRLVPVDQVINCGEPLYYIRPVFQTPVAADFAVTFILHCWRVHRRAGR